MSDTTAIVRHEPLKISGSHQAREERAQTLANDFVKFISDHIPLLLQVRQDFLDKERDETICGVKTFTDYCESVLRYSASHIRNLISGHNPASQKFDGTANRLPKDGESNHFPERYTAYMGWTSSRAKEAGEYTFAALIDAQNRALREGDDNAVAIFEGVIERHVAGYDEFDDDDNLIRIDGIHSRLKAFVQNKKVGAK